MGGKSSQNPAPVMDAAGQAYYQRYPDVAQSGMDPYRHYQMHGQSEGRTWGIGAPPPMPHFSFAPMLQDMERQRAEAERKQAEMLAQQRAEQERAEGIANLNNLFTSRLAAANRAIADVDSQIRDEAAHASTRGIDYTVTDQEKQERINNLFADYWSEEDDVRFFDLNKRWGSDSTKWTLPVERGTSAGSQGALKEGATAGGPVRKGGTVLTEREEEEEDGTVLGGK